MQLISKANQSGSQIRQILNTVHDISLQHRLYSEITPITSSLISEVTSNCMLVNYNKWSVNCCGVSRPQDRSVFSVHAAPRYGRHQSEQRDETAELRFIQQVLWYVTSWVLFDVTHVIVWNVLVVVFILTLLGLSKHSSHSYRWWCGNVAVVVMQYAL